MPSAQLGRPPDGLAVWEGEQGEDLQENAHASGLGGVETTLGAGACCPARRVAPALAGRAVTGGASATFTRRRLACALAQALLLGVVACGPATPLERPLAISPADITLNPGERHSFRAVSRASAPLVWQASGGSVAASGAGAVFTAPMHEGRYQLTVRSGPHSASAAIRVVLPEALAGGQASVSGSVTTANRLIPLRAAPPTAAAALWLLEAAGEGAAEPRELLVRYLEPARAPTLRPLLEAAYGLELRKAGAEGAPDLFAIDLFASDLFASDLSASDLSAIDLSASDLFANTEASAEASNDQAGLGGLALEHEAAVGASEDRAPRGAAALAARLERDPRVASADVNEALTLAVLPADPRLLEQWHMAASGLPVAWARKQATARAQGSAARGGTDAATGERAPVVVAVIDSGFDLEHEDLSGRFLPGYDFCADLTCDHSDDDPSYGSADNFHGTHVAGILGATGGNGLGVTGVAHGGEVMLLPVKIFNDRGGGATLSTLIDGLRYAVGLEVVTADGKRVVNPNPARVVNLSLGSYEASSAVQATIDEVRARGAVIVAATGNQGMAQIMSPAAAAGVLAVGAATQEFKRACFSNYGSSSRGPGGVDLLAPGGEGKCGEASGQAVLSTVPGNRYALAAGTSMAAPMVAGVAALLLSDNPALSAAEVEARLLQSAYFDPAYMTAEEYGAGVLRADRAFGLPGPGDGVRVRLTAPGGEYQAVVTLDLAGGSSPFALRVPPGDYRLSAGEDAPGGFFASQGRFALAPGENREAVRLELLLSPR